MTFPKRQPVKITRYLTAFSKAISISDDLAPAA